jgi:hypothetical protein
VDRPARDAGSPDPDAGPADAGGGLDAGLFDSGVGDAGIGDAGSGDAGEGDAGSGDAGADDAGSADAGSADAGVGDSGVGDAGPFDSGVGDAGVGDAGMDAGFDAGTDAGFDAGFDAGTGDWWDPAWRRRLRVDVDLTGIDAVLADVPVPLQMTAPADVGTLPDDLRIVPVGGADPIPHEVELWQPGADSVVWFTLPSPPANSTASVWLYFDNPSTTSVASGPATFPEPQRAVLHLTGSRDSTATGAHLSVITGAPTPQAGRVGGALSFDGVDDVLEFPNLAPLSLPTPYTVELWFRLDQAFDSTSLVSLCPLTKWETDDINFSVCLIGADWNTGEGVPRGVLNVKHETALGGGSNYVWSGRASWQAGVWYHVALVAPAGSDVTQRLLYVDGAPDRGGDANPGNTSDLELAADYRLGGGRLDSYNVAAGATAFPGRIDEVRITAVARPPAWIALQVELANGQRVTAGAVENAP